MFNCLEAEVGIQAFCRGVIIIGADADALHAAFLHPSQCLKKNPPAQSLVLKIRMSAYRLQVAAAGGLIQPGNAKCANLAGRINCNDI